MPSPAWIFLPFNKSLHREDFDCGSPPLNQYLRKQANQDSKRNLSRVFVAASSQAPDQIKGYYTLSAGSVALLEFPEYLQKKLPQYPIPVLRIGRLAVDRSVKSQGLGEALLVHALKKAWTLSAQIGVLAVIVEAKDARAKSFYERYGFKSFPKNELKLFLPIKTLAQSFSSGFTEEKVRSLRTGDALRKRGERGDPVKALEILRRAGSDEKPREGDEP